MRTIITFALIAVLAITFASCRRNSEPVNTNEVSKGTAASDSIIPQFVCYYGCVEHSYMSEDTIERRFQVYRDIECPLPVNEAWAKIRADILRECLDLDSIGVVYDMMPLKTLKEYPHVIVKDTECSYAYNHNNYASRRTFYLGDSLYGSYLLRKWYNWGIHSYEGYYYQYYNTLIGNRLLVTDLLSNDTAVTRYLDSTIRHSDIAWGILVDTIKPNDNFIISDSNLTFVYNQYEIGCYAIDTVMCTVPLSVFKPYIRTNWKYLWK